MDNPIVFWVAFFLTAGFSNLVVYYTLRSWTRWQYDYRIARLLKWSQHPRTWYALPAAHPNFAEDVLWQIDFVVRQQGLVGAFGKGYMLFSGRVRQFECESATKLWSELEKHVFALLPKSVSSDKVKAELLSAFELNPTTDSPRITVGREIDSLEFSLLCVGVASVFEIPISLDLLQQYLRKSVLHRYGAAIKPINEYSRADVIALAEVFSFGLSGSDQRSQYTSLVDTYILRGKDFQTLTYHELEYMQQFAIDIWRKFNV